jgi:hypothetical protein
MRVICTCQDCGKVIEKRASGTDEDRIAESMVSYLARRHREKTGHKTSAIERRSDEATESPN